MSHGIPCARLGGHRRTNYLDHTEHVHGGLVVLNKHGVVDLAEAEEIEDLPDLRKEQPEESDKSKRALQERT